jgi:hypothetical protein
MHSQPFSRLLWFGCASLFYFWFLFSTGSSFFRLNKWRKRSGNISNCIWIEPISSAEPTIVKKSKKLENWFKGQVKWRILRGIVTKRRSCHSNFSFFFFDLFSCVKQSRDRESLDIKVMERVWISVNVALLSHTTNNEKTSFSQFVMTTVVLLRRLDPIGFRP